MVRQRALVLEDEYLVALDIETTLLGMGFDTVDIATSLAGAVLALEKGDYDCVLLDVNISGETSFDLARDLAARQIPFGFISGYSDTSGFPDDLKQSLVLGKPFDDGEFASFVANLLGDHEKAARLDIKEP
jgi:CheY-like chemotaxis protein